MNRLALALCFVVSLTAQPRTQTATGQVRFEVRSGSDAVPGATVVVDALTVLTDEVGEAVVTLPAGAALATVTANGFSPRAIQFEVLVRQQQVVQVALEPQPTAEEEVTVIASARSDRPGSDSV